MNFARRWISARGGKVAGQSGQNDGRDRGNMVGLTAFRTRIGNFFQALNENFNGKNSVSTDCSVNI